MPRTYNDLFPKICSFENLHRTYLDARKGKRYKGQVSDFSYHLEHNLIRLREELISGEYRPGSYHNFYIYEPKKRLISAAPFRDRVVHHALCNIIEPIFDKTFIYDSYACRKGKGTHKAVDRFTEFCRKARYVLKCDIQKYFPSIDHAILLEIIGRKIRCAKTMRLIGLIIASGIGVAEEIPYQWFPGDDLFTLLRPKGLPIGNLTSQFFGNIYLNELDQFVKSDLRCKYYIRYVDDFVVLSDDKTELHKVKDQIYLFLERLRLRIHPKKARVFPVSEGTDFLGYRVYPTHRLLRKSNVKLFTHRLKRLADDFDNGFIEAGRVVQSINSWVGHASHADTYHLRCHLLGDYAMGVR